MPKQNRVERALIGVTMVEEKVDYIGITTGIARVRVEKFSDGDALIFITPEDEHAVVLFKDDLAKIVACVEQAGVPLTERATA